MLATGPHSRVGSGSGSTRNRTVATSLTTRKTRTVGNGPVLPPKTRHFKFTILAPIKYLSSDRITTWSIRRLCSINSYFTSRIQICDRTNIRWVATENPRISLKICPCFTATQRILIRSQIWMLEVKELVKLYNLHIHHVTIQSELRYLIGAKVVGTIKWNRGPGLCPVRVTNPPRQSGSGCLAVPDPDRGLRFGSNPDRSRVTRNRC